MSEHFTELNIERYQSRLMSPAELLAADDHLAVCEPCRLKVIGTARAEAMMFDSLRSDMYGVTDTETAHLSYKQIAALIDNEISDTAERETIEAHIKICHPCAEEVKDLSAFAATLTTTTDHQTRTASPTMAERFAAFWQSQWALPQFAAAVLLAAAVATIMLFVWNSTTDLTQPESARLSPTPTIVQPSSSPTASESLRPSGVASPDTTASARPDDKLSSPPPPAIDLSASNLIELNDGDGRITLDRRGNVKGLDGLSASSRQRVKTALTIGAVQNPRGLAELRGSTGLQMGDSVEDVAFQTLSPVGVVVRSTRPTLRWQTLKGATSYTVTLTDSRFNVVATSPPLTVTAWTVPLALARGEAYTWQAAAIKDGKEVISPAAPAPEARFKVLERGKVGELEGMERARIKSHLTRGVLYAEAGLISDAEREFTALVKANPQSSTARSLLRSVKRLRPATQ